MRLIEFGAQESRRAAPRLAWPMGAMAEAHASLARRLPQRPWSLGLCAALMLARRERALAEALDTLAGRSVRIEVSDLGICATLGLRRGHCVPLSRDTAADVSFRAKAADFLCLLRRQEDPDTLFFQRRLSIEGDTALGLELKNLLDSVEPPGWLQMLL